MHRGCHFLVSAPHVGSSLNQGTNDIRVTVKTCEMKRSHTLLVGHLSKITLANSYILFKTRKSQQYVQPIPRHSFATTERVQENLVIVSSRFLKSISEKTCVISIFDRLYHTRS